MKVQILISAYGSESIERIASLPHPEYPDVEYLIGWQYYDKNRIPQTLSRRDDFKILFSEEKGLCKNRNLLLEAASADYVVISDDDVAYTETHLSSLMKALENCASYDFFSFKYESVNYSKQYPKESFEFPKTPKGYYLTSMELVLKLDSVRRKGIKFHEDFGVNGRLFGSGEEDILIENMLRRGLNGKFIPVDICVNTRSTTFERVGDTEEFIATKGAVMTYLHPKTWILRMVVHTWRNRSHIPVWKYIGWWKRGALTARVQRIFDKY